MDTKPASYPQTSTSEVNSITTLQYILDNNRVKHDLSMHDKVPNIDGTLELVDDSLSPIGKLEVQVKTLKERHSDTPKHQCTKSFLAYCKQSTLPVLLVTVDSVNEKAYWIHVNRNVVQELFAKIKGATIQLIMLFQEMTKDILRNG